MAAALDIHHVTSQSHLQLEIIAVAQGHSVHRTVTVGHVNHLLAPLDLTVV